MGNQPSDELPEPNYHFRYNHHINTNNNKNNNNNENNNNNRNNINKCVKNSRNAICFLHNLHNIRGKILFHQCSEYDPVRVVFDLEGVPGKKHAIHIHEYADITEGCKSLGAHFNPYGDTHGSILYKDQPRHAGDLINNILFDHNGRFFYQYDDDMISLMPTNMGCIMGRSVVIHESPDDLGRGIGKFRKESLITGNAGNRINYGIIGVAELKHF